MRPFQQTAKPPLGKLKPVAIDHMPLVSVQNFFSEKPPQGRRVVHSSQGSRIKANDLFATTNSGLNMKTGQANEMRVLSGGDSPVSGRKTGYNLSRNDSAGPNQQQRSPSQDLQVLSCGNSPFSQKGQLKNYNSNSDLMGKQSSKRSLQFHYSNNADRQGSHFHNESSTQSLELGLKPILKMQPVSPDKKQLIRPQTANLRKEQALPHYASKGNLSSQTHNLQPQARIITKLSDQNSLRFRNQPITAPFSPISQQRPSTVQTMEGKMYQTSTFFAQKNLTSKNRERNRSSMLMNIEEQLIQEEQKGQNYLKEQTAELRNIKKRTLRESRRPQTAIGGDNGQRKQQQTTTMKEMTYTLLSKRVLGSLGSQGSLAASTVIKTNDKQDARGGSQQRSRMIAKQSVNSKQDQFAEVKSGKNSTTIFSAFGESDAHLDFASETNSPKKSQLIKQKLSKIVESSPKNDSPSKDLAAVLSKQNQLASFVTSNGGTHVANLQCDIDAISQHDPILADLINTKISPLTDIENQTTEKQLERLRIVQDNITELTYNMRVSTQVSTNSHEHLSKIDKYIKLLQYKLSRLVTTYADFHIVLVANTTINIDLIEQTPIYCKIDTINKQPPLKIIIEHQENVHSHARSHSRHRNKHTSTTLRPDWKIFVSDKHMEPNEVNSQYVFTNQYKLNIEPKRAGLIRADPNAEFQGDYLYFNFFSLKGCSIKITAKYPKEEEDNENKANKKVKFSAGAQLKKFIQQQREEISQRVKDIIENPSGLLDLNEEIAQLRARQRERLFGSMHSANFIEQNMLNIDRYANKEDAIKERMSAKKEMIIDHQQKKEELEMEKLKRNVFLVHKWEIIKNRRLEHEHKMAILNQKQIKNFTWHLYIKLSLMMRDFFEKFNEVRWFTKLMKARNNAAKKLQKGVRKFQASRGALPRSRLIKEFKMAHSFMQTLRQEHARIKAKQVMFDYLELTSQKKHLYWKFRRYITLILKVQRDWRNRLLQDQKKLESLSLMWDKEKTVMIEYYQKVKTAGNPKSRRLNTTRLMALPETLKMSILQKYFQKCKTEFTICFIEYRLDLNPSNFWPSIYQYIEDLKRQLRTTDKELFTGIKDDPVQEYHSIREIDQQNQDIPVDQNQNQSNLLTQNFTSAVIHASVNKETLAKEQTGTVTNKQEESKKQLPTNGSTAKAALLTAQLKKQVNNTNKNLLTNKQAVVATQKSGTFNVTNAGTAVAVSGNPVDLDKSFDRKALVDKISQRVEFIYLPSYQQMRRLIQKAVKINNPPKKL